MSAGSIKFKGTTVDATGYVINHAVKLPDWVKCQVCKKGPTPMDWLKPIHPEEKNCTHLIHLSHIPNAPVLSEEASWIARNS